MTREIINYLDTNENEYIKHPNLWDAVKAVVRGKFVPISAYIKKKKSSQINNTTLHLRELEQSKLTQKLAEEGNKD